MKPAVQIPPVSKPRSTSSPAARPFHRWQVGAVSRWQDAGRVRPGHGAEHLASRRGRCTRRRRGSEGRTRCLQGPLERSSRRTAAARSLEDRRPDRAERAAAGGARNPRQRPADADRAICRVQRRAGVLPLLRRLAHQDPRRDDSRSAAGQAARRALSFTLREPLGVVGAITPWNSPLPMVMLKIAPALATGCTLVLKPAELTPLTAMRLVELCAGSGRSRRRDQPRQRLRCLRRRGARRASGHRQDRLHRLDRGRSLDRAASAGNLKKVTLELGGKSPMVVFADADLEQVIPGAARGCFFLQGQNCMAATRLFVHEKVHDQGRRRHRGDREVDDPRPGPRSGLELRPR
jgi:hypothetical protein